MSFPSHAAYLALILIACSDAATRGGDDVAKLLQSKNPHWYAENLLRIVTPADVRQLDELSNQSHQGVALAAAWERVIRVATRNKADASRRELDFELARFLGLVEGRLKFPVPPGWSARLRSGVPEFPNDDQRVHYWRFTDGTKSPKPLETLLKSGERLAVNVGDKDFAIPLASYADRRIPRDATVLSTDKRGYAAFYDYPPNAYKLYAFDPDMRLTWQTTVWADSIKIYQGLSGDHAVEIIESTDSVYVFGGSGNAVYIEAFAQNTGENQWRFSNVYFETLEAYRFKKQE